LRDRVSSRAAAPLFDRYAIVSAAPTAAPSERWGLLFLHVRPSRVFPRESESSRRITNLAQPSEVVFLEASDEKLSVAKGRRKKNQEEKKNAACLTLKKSRSE